MGNSSKILSNICENNATSIAQGSVKIQGKKEEIKVNVE
jgi:hypothetical protein